MEEQDQALGLPEGSGGDGYRTPPRMGGNEAELSDVGHEEVLTASSLGETDGESDASIGILHEGAVEDWHAYLSRFDDYLTRVTGLLEENGDWSWEQVYEAVGEPPRDPRPVARRLDF